MANNINIKVNVETNGKGELQALNMDLADFSRAAASAAKAAGKVKSNFERKIVTTAALTNTLTGLTSAANDINAVFSDLSAAYAVQQQAETQLATVMRQRMAATEADIEAIKNLASAQQALGVVGDEVQLAGAQQVATFLTQRSSIETLLPAMNNLLVQQKGLKATGTDAVAIANLVGKAMQGQTSALKRVGISFTETQKQMMEHGNESERAATLAQIITDNVGQMNAEMAKTSSGQIQQVANKLGDLKESAGKAVQSYQPFVAMAAQATTAYTGVYRLVIGIKSLSISFMELIGRIAPLRNLIIGLTMQFQVSTTAARVLTIAWRGMLIATGVGAAVLAVSAACEYFSRRSREAAEATDVFVQAQKRSKEIGEQCEQARLSEMQSVEAARTKIQSYITQLESFNGTKTQEKKLIDDLNTTYGSSMGHFSTLSDWYKTLTANSETYCRQLTVEAQARILADRIAQKSVQRREITHNADGTVKWYKKNRTKQWVSPEEAKARGTEVLEHRAVAHVGMQVLIEVEGTSDIDKANASVKQIDKEIAADTKELNRLNQERLKLTMPVTGSPEPPKNNPDKPDTGKQWKENAQTLDDYTNNLSILDERLKTISPTETEEIEQIKKTRTELQAYIAVLRERLGLEKQRGRALDEPIKVLEPAAQTSVVAAPDVKPPEGLQRATEMWDAYAESVKGAGDAVADNQQAITNISSTMSSLSRVVSDSAGAWLQYGANVLSAVAQALPQILALTAAKKGEAMSEAIAGGAQMKFPLSLFAIGASVAAVLAAFAQIPQFANGGIISGPTLGLMGEYAGASNNPEVVAPLNTLQKYLNPAPAAGGKVEFVIKGRDLVGVQRARQNYTART